MIYNNTLYYVYCNTIYNSIVLYTQPSAQVEYRDLDLSSLKSVKLFSEFFIASGLSLNILVCNGGVYEPQFKLTEDGLEKHFGINFLGHFYLVSLLIDVLLKSQPSRVVIVSSDSHWYVRNIYIYIYNYIY